MSEYEPMEVQRVHEGNGSHIEPPLEQSWDDLTKLRWHAGVVKADSGVAAHIMPGAMSEKAVLGVVGPYRTRWDIYAIRVGNASHSAYTFREAWDFLNGVETGARAVRESSVPS
jgi:ABC-type Fe3+ transport system substrate-binding protein